MINQKLVQQDLSRKGRVRFAVNNDAAKREFSRMCRRLSDEFDSVSSDMKSFKDTLREASEFIFSDHLPRNNRDQAAGAIQKMKSMCDFMEKNCSRIASFFDKGDRF